VLEDRSLAALFPSSADAIPEAVRIQPDRNPATMLIDGRVRRIDAADAITPIYSRVGIRSGDTITATLLGYEPRVGTAEAAEALAAAERAWGGGKGAWPTATLDQRIAAVERFAASLRGQTDAIAHLLVHEIGKPIAAARAEVTRSIGYIEETVIAARRISDGVPFTGVNGTVTHHARERMRPLGKVLCVAPFNYPINEFLTTIIPALLVGNVVIAKTPRVGVLANQLLAGAFAEAFPAGVVALLPGDGRVVLPALISASRNDLFGHPVGAIDVLAFIGSEGAANAILARHPTPSFVHKILGLGAKNAAIVLPGSDPAVVAPKLAKGSLGFNGQRCTAEKIIFVPAGAEGDAHVRALGDKIAALPLGMPWDPAAAITPLPEERKLEAMWGLVEDALARGARLVNPDGGRGFYSIMRPAVLDGVGDGMRIFHEEQFGPIVPIARYSHVDEVIAWHHTSPYGQQVGIHGPNGRALVDVLSAYCARINLDDICQRGPDTFGFTAADKSGFGTLSIEAALRSFSRTVIVQSPTAAAI
jgi:glyceraldehyde-3-phosphate dehydrogenase (NADP+)